ncbi:unnamed protein product [Allacma fusca]|uniref:Uncharacterized protein n=1 Tax=Allacma fusca TaxID=39272 RepID=A0A8J2K1K5_9HEXA|nr:unnamed protein product [Allacma fusca]
MTCQLSSTVKPNLVSIQQMLGRVMYHREDLITLDRLIDEALLEDNATDAEMVEEYDAATEYGNKSSNVEEVRDQTTKNQYRLPEIEFKKYNGDAKEWLGFWSQFKQIDRDDRMSSEEKFQYLIQV